jgi:hypothetical protein
MEDEVELEAFGGNPGGNEFIDDPSFQLTQLSLTDSSGNPLPLSDLTSDSGVPLTASGYASPSPEPASYSLVGLGIALFAVSSLWKALLPKSGWLLSNIGLGRKKGRAPSVKTPGG